MKGYFVSAAIIAMIMILPAMPASSQTDKLSVKEQQAPQATPAQASGPVSAQTPQAAPVDEAAKMAELSIYGEVQTVNAQAGSISVQYYDYDNDEEKTMEVVLDKDSKMENVKVVGEIKKGDWVDVTYVSAGGKNIIKMVSVEKEEPAAEESAPADTME